MTVEILATRRHCITFGVQPKQVHELFELMEPHISQDCGILLVPKVAAAKFPDKLKLYLPWLLKPSMFAFNMSNSPSYLPEQIFGVVEFAIYFLPAENSWYVLGLSEEIQKFLEVPESNFDDEQE